MVLEAAESKDRVPAASLSNEGLLLSVRQQGGGVSEAQHLEGRRSRRPAELKASRSYGRPCLKR